MLLIHVIPLLSIQTYPAIRKNWNKQYQSHVFACGIAVVCKGVYVCNVRVCVAGTDMFTYC